MALGTTPGAGGVLVVLGVIPMLALLVKAAAAVAWIGLALFAIGLVVMAASLWGSGRTAGRLRVSPAPGVTGPVCERPRV